MHILYYIIASSVYIHVFELLFPLHYLIFLIIGKNGIIIDYLFRDPVKIYIYIYATASDLHETLFDFALLLTHELSLVQSLDLLGFHFLREEDVAVESNTYTTRRCAPNLKMGSTKLIVQA